MARLTKNRKVSKKDSIKNKYRKLNTEKKKEIRITK